MVKRYEESGESTEGTIYMPEGTYGGWVVYDDYAALEAQVRHLEVYPGRCERLEIENAALRYKLSKLEGEK